MSKIRDWIYNKYVTIKPTKEHKFLHRAVNKFRAENRGLNKAYIFLSGGKGKKMWEDHVSFTLEKNKQIDKINPFLRKIFNINKLPDTYINSVLGIPIIFDDRVYTDHAEIRVLGNQIKYVEKRGNDNYDSVLELVLLEEKQDDYVIEL